MIPENKNKYQSVPANKAVKYPFLLRYIPTDITLQAKLSYWFPFLPVEKENLTQSAHHSTFLQMKALAIEPCCGWAMCSKMLKSCSDSQSEAAQASQGDLLGFVATQWG
jgi:hypothetical protein